MRGAQRSPHMQDEDEIDWERIETKPGVLKERVGRLKGTKIICTRIHYDSSGREIERIAYDAAGEFRKRVIYEYDSDRRPRLICAFNKEGKMIYRHERGKRPEQLL